MSNDRNAEVADLAVARQKRKKEAAVAPSDATHDELAKELLRAMEHAERIPAVAAEGQLWVVDQDPPVWRSMNVDALSVQAAERLRGAKLCRKEGDYRAIARHAMNIAQAPDYFEDAPHGLACPSGFWTIDETGCASRVDLAPLHRQRFIVPADPQERSPARFLALLANAFAGDADAQVAQEQIDLAAEAVGAALFGMGRSIPIVVLLLGSGATGKSTFLNVIGSLFDKRAQCSIGPQYWGQEYFLAGLAGKRLNVVGELDEKALPSGAFKTVTGLDLLSARHPTHRPFWFRCEAAHFFNSNVLPGTTDRTDAFFRRWRILRFSNPVDLDKRDPHLAARIISDELGGVLHWAIAGAERVARRDRLATTRVHDSVMRKWSLGSNPVLLFLTDPDFCRLDAGAQTPTRQVYGAYVEWAKASGNRAMSSQAFWQLLDETSGRIGVRRKRRATERLVEGVSLNTSGLFAQVGP